MMAENKLADLSMDFAVSILKVTNGIKGITNASNVKTTQNDDCPKTLTRSFLQCASSPRQKGSNPHANEDFPV